MGNKSLHVEDQPDEVTVLVLNEDQTEVAGFFFESINAVVDELVTKRSRADEMFGKLPAGVRANVEGLLDKD